MGRHRSHWSHATSADRVAARQVRLVSRVADHDRPLAGRGRREAVLAGRWLRENGVDVDLVLCSSAKRTRQTWKRVAGELASKRGAGPELRVEDRLYAASERQLLRAVRALPDSARAVLLVGHNPGLEDLVAVLTGVWRPLKTSSIAVLSSRSGWAAAGVRWARLDASATPRS
jgi:phosphohistidine phosphatase